MKSLFLPKTKKDIEFLDQFINNKKIITKNFGDVVFDKQIWDSGPLDNRSWLWTLHSFVVFDSLIAVGEIDLLIKLIAGWSERFEDVAVEEDFPWHDHATALRLDRISRIAIQFSNCNLEGLAKKHGNLLLKNDFYEKNTNHGFDQSLSLILASLAFPKISEASQWQVVGLARLRSEIDFAFTSEGVHVENSPAYHMGMIGNMLRARRLLRYVNIKYEDFDSLFNKAFVFLAWITRPDRFLTYLGDSVSYRPNVAHELMDLPNASMVEWVASAGNDGIKPENKCALFEESGYFIYRSSWDDWPGHTYIVFKSGFLSGYHRQDDDLNILLHAYGEDWLIDSGMYNHNQKDPVRQYMRSVKAHNVLYFPGVKIDRRNVGEGFSGIKAIEVDGWQYAVEGFTSMYSTGKVFRRILISNKDKFRVFDSFFDFGDNKKYWMFHFPLDKLINFENGVVNIFSKTKRLSISPSIKDLKVSLYKGFNQDFPSLISKKINHKEDSQVVVFESCLVGSVFFDFCFSDF